MLQQQLQQRDEDLAARKAEISDLKERVAELENLKQQQDQLLTMKDSELAAAQQRLADARNAAAAVTSQPAAAVTQTAQQTQPVQEPQPQDSNMMPWLWGGMAIVGLGLLAWLLLRRRPARIESKQRRSFDSEALAASMRAPVVAASTESELETLLTDKTQGKDVAPPAVREQDFGQVMDLSELPSTPGAHVEAPTWHSGRWMKADGEPGVAVPIESSPRFVPPAEEPNEPLPATLNEPLPEPVSAQQRMKLARAFLDIGDQHSAKQLLVELKEGAADTLLRTEASKLLRDLG